MKKLKIIIPATIGLSYLGYNLYKNIKKEYLIDEKYKKDLGDLCEKLSCKLDKTLKENQELKNEIQIIRNKYSNLLEKKQNNYKNRVNKK